MDVSAANQTNAISKAGKKAEGFGNKWVLMDAKCSHPRIMLPMGMPVSHDGWFRARLTDPRAAQVLEKMTADLRPGDSRAAKMTGGHDHQIIHDAALGSPSGEPAPLVEAWRQRG